MAIGITICNKEVADVHLDKISHVSCCQWRHLPLPEDAECGVVHDIDQGPGGEDEKGDQVEEYESHTH